MEGTSNRSAVIAVDGSAKLFTNTPEVPKMVAATRMASGPVGLMG
jgi:hypothetical protein